MRASVISWLLAACLIAAVLPQLPGALKHFAVPFAEEITDGGTPFWRPLAMIGYPTAASIVLLSVYSLWQMTKEGQIPLSKLFIGSRIPCIALGVAALVGGLVSYMVKQGSDTRHLYVLGIAVLGVTAMSALAALGFALLHGPSKPASRSIKQQGSGVHFGLCALQVIGATTAIMLLLLPLSWGLGMVMR